MRKVELLSPAGTYECFQAALRAGADAVYLGGDRFGARAFAGNFSSEEVCRAIEEANRYGKKVYLTVNTLLKEKEMEDLIPYLTPFYEAGLHGVIIQDVGVFERCRKAFPGLELHASTQMTVTDRRGAQLLKEMGAARFVPARELSLEEIREIKAEVGLDVEAFIHGALCYCYSGQCLFSSLLGGRSGNRGKCAQPCRQPYAVKIDGKTAGKGEEYPLSLKDLCTIERLPDLIEAGIDSFKIEGRMKRAEYVAGVTAMYRKYMDLYAQKGRKGYRVSEEDLDFLRKLYIRSEISEGYYHNHNGREMVTLQKPGYAGCDDSVLAQIRETWMKQDLTVSVNLKGRFFAGKSASLTLTAGDNSVTVQGMAVSEAQKKPMSEADLRRQLGKMGGTGFCAGEIAIEMGENVFLPVSGLNELRRNGLQALQETMAARGRRAVQKQEAKDGAEGERNRTAAFVAAAGRPERTADAGKEPERTAGTAGRHGSLGEGKPLLGASVLDLPQALAVLERKDLSFCYLPADLFLNAEAGEKEALLHAVEQRRAVGDGWTCFLSLPPILRNYSEGWLKRVQRLREEVPSLAEGIQMGSPGALKWLQEIGFQGKLALDHRIYIWNRETYDWWDPYMDRYCAPLELNRKSLFRLPQDKQEVMVYGRIPMMVSAGCVRKTEKQCMRKLTQEELERGVGKRRIRQFLTDRYQAEFPVLTDCVHCMNIIYNSVPLSLHDYVEEIAAGGVQALRLDFTTERAQETDAVCSWYAALLEGRRKGEPVVSAYTTGHYKKGAD